jgi:putative drug exporter of the RND superfamily
VFGAKSGKVSDDQAAVNQATTNVAKLPDVIKAVSPFASPNSGAVSKDGAIAYSSVSWSVNPNSLETDYLNRLDQAVAPAKSAGLRSPTAPGRSGR